MDTTLHDPLIGRLLDGRYRIEERVAAGGMATVYRALDTRLDRVVALKVMHPSLAADTGFVERFIREAKSVARLGHGNVVAVYDQGADDGYVYLAMEYIAGCTLRDVLRERGALTPRLALDIMEPVLAALGAAHRAGLVHRDMKPENVLIGQDGRVKVADFGLVRAVGTETATTTTGSVLGTAAYLAPEQIEHGTADERCDVYACGVLLYETLTGAKPHDGATPAQVLYQHLHEEVGPPSAAVPGLAPGLDSLVARAAARAPQDRPSDAVELLGLLRAVRAELTPVQLDAVPPAATALATSASAGASAGGSSREDRTTVIPRVPGAVGTSRTTRYQVPPDLVRPEEPQAADRRRPAGASRRGFLAVVTVLAVIFGVVAVVWYVGAGQFTRVPAVLAMPRAQAVRTLRDAGLGVSEAEAFSDTVRSGHVISTDPGPGARIRGNGTVQVVVSRGPERVSVPDVSGAPLDQARQRLTAAGLTPGTVTRVFSGTVAEGWVISTSPAAGTTAQSGTAVALTVSRGQEVSVPDVVGASVSDARQQLAAVGLNAAVAPVPAYSDTVPQDAVAAEGPGAGAQVARGDTITLTVSRGPQLSKVPDVKGMKVGAAQQKLRAAGFKVRVIQVFFTGKVFSESPGGGSMRPKNTTITLWAR